MTYLPPPKGQFDVEWATQNNRIIQQEISRLAPLATRVAELETGKQPLDGDLTAIASLTGTGYLKRTGTDAWALSATIPSTDITGLGTMSTQNATAVNIDGGTIDGTAIGGASPSTGAFTTLSATGLASFNGSVAVNGGEFGVYKGSGDQQRVLISVPGTDVEYNATRASGTVPQHVFKIDATTYGTLSTTGLSIAGTLSTTGNATVGTSSGGLIAGRAADNTGAVIAKGGGKAVRIGATSTSSVVEGVDETGFSSFQPLRIGGSSVAIGVSGGTTMTVGASSVSITGTLSVSSTISASNLAGTTYTPTLFNASGLDTGASSVGTWQYMRVGNTVTVSGCPTIATTAANAQFEISLPIASNFTNIGDCAGTGIAVALSGTTGASVEAGITNNRAYVRYYNTGSGSGNVSFHFTYTVK